MRSGLGLWIVVLFTTWFIPQSAGAQTGSLVHALAWSPDGGLLAAATDIGVTVYRVDGTNLQILWSIDLPLATVVTFAPNNRWIAAITYQGMVYVWDIGKQREIVSFQASQFPQALAFSPDGLRLAVGGGYFPTRMGSDYELHVWNTTSWTELDYADTKRFGDMSSVAFSPDGQLIAYGGYDSYMPICDALTGTLLAPIYPQPDGVVSITFSPDSRYVAFQSRDNVQLWEIHDEPEFHLVLSRRWPEVDAMREFPDHPLTSVAFVADNQKLFAWLEADGSITVRDITAGDRILAAFTAENGPSTMAVFSPVGKYLAVADYVGNVTVKAVDLSNEQSPGVIPEYRPLTTIKRDSFLIQYQPEYFAFSPNGTQIAAAATDVMIYGR